MAFFVSITFSNFREEQIVQTGFQILEGLVHLHNNNVTHRNLGLENVLLDKEVDILYNKFRLCI